MKVFLSGPISGVEGYKKRFREAETALKAMGHEVYSPAVLPEGMPWEAFKADDVGRTVFLTREAAEEALKAREQE